MANVLTDSRLESIWLDEDEIRSRIDAMALEIKKDYDPSSGPIYMIGILKGACIFQTDLARALWRAGVAVRFGFITASTYQDGMKGEGEVERKVKIKSMTGSDPKGKNILLVDDVLDQGFTLAAVTKYFLNELGANSVKTGVFLKKELQNPSPEVLELRKSFQADYVGFTVPDRWVVGYGLDIAEEFRELPYVAIAREECFR